jgi:hypothetical protein
MYFEFLAKLLKDELLFYKIARFKGDCFIVFEFFVHHSIFDSFEKIIIANVNTQEPGGLLPQRRVTDYP